MKRILSLILAVILATAAQAQRFQLPQAPKAADEIWVLCIGNSFTYHHDADVLLQDIASSQGVRMQVGKYLKGGQTFGQHLGLPETQEAINAGNYDYCFLQDQSVNPARLARDGKTEVLDDLINLKSRIIRKSPDCNVILEHTWSYSGKEAGGMGTQEELDKYLRKGTKTMARKGHTWYSPIGEAFNRVYKERPDIHLLDKDDKHQSQEGAYLKACVNYLVITGKRFSGPVACGGLSPATAAYLRTVAEKTVLGKGLRYGIKRDKSRTFRGEASTRIVAHRGFHLEEGVPENSVAALKASRRIGAWGSEFDIWLTRDNRIVINHDKYYGTDPEQRIIAETDYAALQDIRLANCEEIPTLEAFIAEAKEQPGVKLVCELKRHGGSARNRALFDEAYRIAESEKVLNRFVWQTFDYELCQYIREKDPYATVIWLCTKEEKLKKPEEIAADGLSGVNFRCTLYDAHPEFIEKLHRLGLTAGLCAEDDLSVIHRFAEAGIDFIGTNRPREAMEAVR
ncbi:MAG: hypothetical protein II479_05945 [Bacteroidales bacterium]|nr:hypothetical protein [Bacteroidales bacterium]